MAMRRKVAKVGNSLMVAIPSQFAEHDNIKAGDYVEIEHIGIGEFRIKKV